MNERIRELAAEAFESIDYPFKQEINMPDILVEKFAELIVRECMTICEDVAERNDPAIACYYEIKRHFGI